MADTEVSTTPIWVDGTVSATNIRSGLVSLSGGSGVRSSSTITLTGMGGSGTVHVQLTVISRNPGNKEAASGMLGAVVRNPTGGTDPTFVVDGYRLTGTDSIDVYWFAIRGP